MQEHIIFRVICFGHDAMLLSTRKWILEKNFQVEIVDDLTALSALAGENRYDLAILCHSITTEEAQKACDMLRGSGMTNDSAPNDAGNTSSGTKILTLKDGYDPVICDEEIASLEGPRPLLEKVCQMLGVDSADKRRSIAGGAVPVIQRKRNSKCRSGPAIADAASRPDSATVVVDNRLGDRKAQTGAPFLLSSEKGLKHFV